MWRITTFTGTVLEVHRCINTRSRRFERPVCRERRELWLGIGQNDEYQFIIHTKLMPARKTHCVTLVLTGMTVLGLYNATTGANANYVREDPPYLTRRLDILAIALLMPCGLAGMVLCHLSGWLVLTERASLSCFHNHLSDCSPKAFTERCGRCAQ
jgi:hypothetical protein